MRLTRINLSNTVITVVEVHVSSSRLKPGRMHTYYPIFLLSNDIVILDIQSPYKS